MTIREQIGNIFYNLIFWLVIGSILMWAWLLIAQVYARVVSPSFLWKYEQLEPTKESYNINEPITIFSKRSFLTEGHIFWYDYLYCNSDKQWEVLQKRYLYISDAIVYGWKSQSVWVYWQNENKEYYKTTKIWQDCYIESRQVFKYHGVDKVQTFISWPFNIIKWSD